MNIITKETVFRTRAGRMTIFWRIYVATRQQFKEYKSAKFVKKSLIICAPLDTV